MWAHKLHSINVLFCPEISAISVISPLYNVRAGVSSDRVIVRNQVMQMHSDQLSIYCITF